MKKVFLLKPYFELYIEAYKIENPGNNFQHLGYNIYLIEELGK